MKNKMFKKFGAMIMALVLILTSIGNMSTSFAKSDYFDPDDLYWEFPYRCQDDAVEFEAFKKPITVEAESREITPIIKDTFKVANDEAIMFIIKIYNEQAGNRIIYFPGNYALGVSVYGKPSFTFYYGDKIDVSYSINKVSNPNSLGFNFPCWPIEIIGRGLKFKGMSYCSEYDCEKSAGYIDGKPKTYIEHRSTNNYSLNITNSTSKKMNLTFYNNEGVKVEKARFYNITSYNYDFEDNDLPKYLMPGKTSIIKINYKSSNLPSKDISQIVINNLETGFKGEVREAKKEFPNEASSSKLAKAKEDAKTEIKAIKDLTAEQVAEYEKKVDEATSDEAVKAIIEEAKKQAETNKASEEEKAQEEALRKAKEEELARAKEEALKKAKEEELAKELAKKNENDPVYQKNKLSKLLEEAKRLRHPSEELEAAIDEAYDILLDKYARLEDYKYAIEKIERILQNRRDTRRNRFKLDVDDINETDTELTGKTGAKWYVDVYNGKKCILSGQANYKGNFSIEIKKGKIKAKDKLKVVATDPQDDKKYKEVEIEVLGSSKNTDNKLITTIDDLLQADGTSEENALSDLSIFPVGKNYYNVVQNNQKTTVYMDVNTYINGNRTMLPIRYIAYALGFNVEYDNFTREAIFSNRENSVLAKKVVRVNIDTGLMRDADGRVYSSDVRPVLVNNRIHASIANIARMFEASQGTIEDGINQTIEWDNARKAVYIFKNVK